MAKWSISITDHLKVDLPLFIFIHLIDVTIFKNFNFIDIRVLYVKCSFRYI